MPDSAKHAATDGRGLLRNRDFVLLWCAYGISAMGDHLSEMAILKTQNALNPGVDITPLSARMTFMFFVPFFLLATIAGTLADRLPRRLIMISADVARCAVMFGFVYLIGWTHSWGTWGPFVPLLIVGIFAAIFSPARSAMLPTLIRPDQLVRANGMIGGLGIIATMIAAKLGGILAERYDPIVSFRLDGLTFIASALCLLFLRSPRRNGASEARVERPPLRALADGFRYVRSHRHVMELLAVAALVWFCGPLVNSVIPAIVRDVYGGGYSAISTYRALLGLGFMLGAILITVLGDALRGEIAITWGLFGIGGGIAVLAASVFLPLDTRVLSWIGGVGVVLAGMSALAVMASFNSLLQRTVADRYLGRVFGVKDLCTTGSLLVATGLLGVPHWDRLDEWVGLILIGVSVLAFGFGAITLRTRLRRGVHGAWLSFLVHLTEFVARFWWRLRRVGPMTVPRNGPVIIAANHVSPSDPLLIIVSVPHRMISFMIAAEYVTWPIIGCLSRTVECIPVRRGTRDTSSTKRALRHLQDGKAMGVFIEGGIVLPGTSRKPKDGAAVLALRTGAPVVPAHISGVVQCDGIIRGLLMRHRACVRFGAPVDLSDLAEMKHSRDVVRKATQRIYDAIQALAPDRSRSLTDGN